MIPIRRFVLWFAVLFATALSATAQLTWAQHGVVPSPSGTLSISLKPASVFDATRNRFLLPIYIPPGFGPGSRTMWEFDGQSWFGPTVQDLPVEEAAVADDPRPGRKVMFSGSGTRIWDPFTRHWDVVTPANSPPLGSGGVMALLPGIGTVLLSHVGSTWVWNGADWTSIVTAHSPPARTDAAMARDVVGNRLLLMGGITGTLAASDAWLFDGTDWTQTISPPVPFSLPLSHAGIATDAVRNRVVVFGGRVIVGYLNTTLLWDGASWTIAAPAHSPPLGPVKGMSWDSTLQRVVAFVNPGGNSGAIATWAWDGTDWTELLPNGRGTVVAPSARSSPVLAYSNLNNKTVLFGGNMSLLALSDTWESAGRLWQQRTSPSNPPATFNAAGALLRSTGDLYYYPGTSFLTTYSEQWNWGGQQWSGLTLSAPPLTPLQWQVAGSLQSSLYGWVVVRLVTSGTGASFAHTLQLILPFSGGVATIGVPGGPAARTASVMVQSHSAAIASNKVWLFGGQTGAGVDQNDVWELADTGSGGNLAWTLLAPTGGPVSPPRSSAGAAHDGGSFLYIMGGVGSGLQLGDTWRFNLVSRQWTQLAGPGPSPRTGAAMTYDASIGRIVLVGGFDTSVLGDIWECDGTTWTQRVTPSTPPPRTNASLVYDRTNHRSLLFGGTTGERLNDTWSYDGSVWTPLVGKGPQPAARFVHTACFDEFWNTMVVCGGSSDGTTLLSDTWRLSGSQIWSPGPQGPPARANAAMTYAVLQGIPCSILVGGYTDAGPIGDTWRYDIGTNGWQQVASGLPARDIHSIAWDRLRNVIVLFGGRDVGNGFLDETWELNLATATWTQRTPAHQPPGRWNGAMQYDAGRARTVLVGGYAPFGYLNDVWDWDGTDWQQRTPETAPPGPHEDAAIAYDSDRGKLLLFGGGNGVNPFGAVLELGARIDVAGPGNSAHPEALRFYSQPALGQPLQLGFANTVLGLCVIGFGPLQQPLGPLPVPLVCEPASLYANVVFYPVLGTTEPNFAWNVPNTPLILGMTLVFQAFSAQPAANCWRATDALQVHF